MTGGSVLFFIPKKRTPPNLTVRFILIFIFSKMYIKSFCIKLFISLSILLFICEFLVYYITIFQCNWPNEKHLQTNGSNPVKVMLIADTHLLGPFRGHWFDKMRREWQMHRAFQTAMTIFHPEIVFVLGDLFDEGNWVNQNEFQEYCERFQKLFYTPKETSLYSLAGNHDIGFHYNTNPTLVNRFDKFFNSSGVDLISRRGVHFVSIDSMAMEGDGCFLCDKAERLLRKISERFKCSKVGNCKNGNELLDGYSQPIILQHFPMYRKSDEDCLEHDSPEIENFREKWEVLSKESTDLLGEF